MIEVNLETVPANIKESIENAPISRVVWLDRSQLFANDYNPNHQAPTESNLLTQSIFEDLWTQPIVIRTTGEIVDGFHRFNISTRPEIQALFGEFVPCVVLPDAKDRASQMLSTIRHNRARGVHAIRPMAAIVKDLMDNHEITEEDLKVRCGMDEEEIERLYDTMGHPERVGGSHGSFSKGWKPGERQEFRIDDK